MSLKVITATFTEMGVKDRFALLVFRLLLDMPKPKREIKAAVYLIIIEIKTDSVHLLDYTVCY